MKIQQFVKQEQQRKLNIHYHDNVWWIQHKKFYCYPIFLFTSFPPFDRKPNRLKSILGYEHLVPDISISNAFLPIMAIEKEKLRNYSFELITSKKRNRIRKADRFIHVKQISNIDEMINKGFEINCSAIARQKRHGARAYYTNRKEWEHLLSVTFLAEDRFDWGAYYNGLLVAYLRGILVEEVMFIYQQMSHSDYLKYNPNDILIFKFIEKYKLEQKVKKIVCGLYSANESLNKFKQNMGFDVINLPLFRWINPVVKPVIPMTRYRHYYFYRPNR